MAPPPCIYQRVPIDPEWLALPFGLIVVFLQFVTALGFLAGQLYVVYYLALVWLLFIATLNFALLLLEDGNAV